MKATLLLVVLTALVAGFSGSVLKSATSRANLNVGSVISGDRLLHRSNLYRQPIANSLQSEIFMYRGYATTRITAVQAVEVGATQYANPYIMAGGISMNNVTIRIQSARGRGYSYQISIWGR